MILYKEIKLAKNSLDPLPIETKSLLHLPAVNTSEHQIYSTSGGFAFEQIIITEQDIEKITKSLLTNGSRLGKLSQFIDEKLVEQFVSTHLKNSSHFVPNFL